MQAVVVSDDDIIHLNVGGQKLTTKRSTLCQVDGSLLASMFNGCRELDGLERDQDGAVSFDFNPQYFVFILDYLRAKKIATPENPPPLPKVPAGHVENFYNLVEYLGLSDAFTEIMPSEKFDQHSEEVTLEEDGKVAVHDATWKYQYVLGENIYRKGIVNFKLKLESFKHNTWMFIGIVKGDVVPPNNYSYRWPGSYGWALGSNGAQAVWKEGTPSNHNTLRNLTKQGDTVALVLDCDAANVLLYLPTGRQFHIQIPKSKTWRLNVNLDRANDKIRIINE